MTQPTPSPQHGGRRRRDRVAKLSEPLLITLIGVTVIALCVLTAVMSRSSTPAADLSAAEPTPARTTSTTSTTPPPQSVVPGAEVEVVEAPAKEKPAAPAKTAGKPGGGAQDGQDELRDEVERIASEAPAVVRVGSFNILGSQHTAPGGTKGGGWPSGAARLPGTIERIRAHRVSVVGLQEAQPEQLAGIVTGTGFAVYPGPDANPLDRVNSIIYDPAVWEAVSATTFPMSNGTGYRPQPVLRLRHIATGREAYFINAHPPAGHDRATVAKRIESMGRIVSVVNGLKPEGLPIIITGDMNDREPFLQRVVRPAGLVPSLVQPGPISVDWVVGTPDVTFSEYTRDTSTVSRRISDHFFIAATATIGATG
ncbi:endonuclease/exonuclease/phosphatase family protein [Nocardioides dongkuii]|uniref:endonuclease/exonuclease/phosphatase family protein n=1 Tax=Nocardioides dongkuii TaxID=2760089 RepID=UPI0015F988E8|nr:endonuclease/exonuclease/phosphatase family protein [Nocardioides dongkuii]